MYYPEEDDDHFCWPCMVIPLEDVDASMVAVQNGEVLLKYFEDGSYQVAGAADIQRTKYLELKDLEWYEKDIRQEYSKTKTKNNVAHMKCFEFFTTGVLINRFKWKAWKEADEKRNERIQELRVLREGDYDKVYKKKKAEKRERRKKRRQEKLERKRAEREQNIRLALGKGGLLDNSEGAEIQQSVEEEEVMNKDHTFNFPGKRHKASISSELSQETRSFVSKRQISSATTYYSDLPIRQNHYDFYGGQAPVITTDDVWVLFCVCIQRY